MFLGKWYDVNCLEEDSNILIPEQASLNPTILDNYPVFPFSGKIFRESRSCRNLYKKQEAKSFQSRAETTLVTLMDLDG